MDLQNKNAKGVREDISDLIMEYRAEDVPAFSAIKKGPKPKAPVVSEPADAPGFSSRRGVKNGTPTSQFVDQSKKYELIESLNHMIVTPIKVGRKDEATVDRAGVGMGKLYAREVKKAMLAHKEAIDCITLDNYDQREEGKDGSETRGLFSWASPTAQAVRPVPADYRPNAAQYCKTALANLTPDVVRGALNAHWRKTHRKSRFMAFCGDSFKATVSDWSMYQANKDGKTVVRSFDQGASKKDRVLSAIIDLLEFDTGVLELHLESHLMWDRDADENYDMPEMASRACIAFPDDAVSYRYSLAPEHEKLPTDGGNELGQISSIFHVRARPYDLVAFAPQS